MIQEQKIAKALLAIDAIGLTKGEPIRFKSGILSPVYVDNRKLPFHPREWKIVLNGFKNLITTKKIKFDIVAGIETGGIPHSAALGFLLNKPSVFVRKAAKDHGTKKRTEGGAVKGKRILLIEDLVTTGGSSLSGVEALRAEGATVTDCLVIISYGFDDAISNFKRAHIKLRPLTTFPRVLEVGVSSKKISVDNAKNIRIWLKDPRGWTMHHEPN